MGFAESFLNIIRKTKMTLFRKLLISCVLITSASSAIAAIQLQDKVPLDPDVKVGHLSNGLTYYIRKNVKPLQRAELRLVVKAGSVLEDDDQQGLAHFVEHMAFNGSKHFEKNQLISYLQSIGIKFGADLNAYTSFDETVYMLPVPLENKKNLETGFQVLEDWARGLSLKDKDIDDERNIVFEELRLRKGVQDRLKDQVVPHLWKGSKYADRFPIGKEDVIKHASYDAVRRFYHDWYRPDLMAVIVVGDIDPVAVEKLIVKHFTGLKNPENERVREYASFVEYKESEAVVLTDKELTMEGVEIHYPIRKEASSGNFAELRRSLIEGTIQMMFNSRIAEVTQKAQSPFNGAGSNKSSALRDYKFFSTNALVGKAGVAAAVKGIIEETQRAKQYGFTQAELDRAKANLLRGMENAFQERDKRESNVFVNEYIRHFTQNEPSPGIANEYKYLNEIVPTIQLKEINDYAKTLFPNADEKKVVIFGGPEKRDTPLPTQQQLLQLVAEAEKLEVHAIEEKKIGTTLMTPPAPGSIVSEKFDKALGTTELVMGNGIHVILKPTDFQNDQILMSSLRFGGSSLFDDKDAFSAMYVDSIVASMGLKDLSPIDLQKVLTGKSLSVSLGMSTESEGFGGSTTRADLEAMLQVTYLKVTQPRRDEELFKSFIQKQKDFSKNSLLDPGAVFGEEIRKTLYNNHPRVFLTPRPEDFDQINLDHQLDLYKQRYGSMKGMTFFFVGSFDVEGIKPLLAKYIATLPTGDIPTEYRDLHIRPVAGVVKKDVYKGLEPKGNVWIQFHGDAKFTDNEQVVFYEMIEVLNIKINEVLREKMSLIYAGGFNGSLDKIPYENYSIGLSLPTAPENVDKAIAAAFAEIQKIKDHGVSEADLKKVQLNWNLGYKRDIRDNGFWIGRLRWAAINGADPHSILTVVERNSAVTPKDIQEAARRYFDFNRYAQFVLYPESLKPKQDLAATLPSTLK